MERQIARYEIVVQELHQKLGESVQAIQEYNSRLEMYKAQLDQVILISNEIVVWISASESRLA